MSNQLTHRLVRMISGALAGLALALSAAAPAGAANPPSIIPIAERTDGLTYG